MNGREPRPVPGARPSASFSVPLPPPLPAPPPESPVDFGDPVSRGRWLASVRACAECIHGAATALLDQEYDSLTRRSTMRRELREAHDRLGRLLAVPGAYPEGVSVNERKLCRCGCGPFEGPACPECGEDDDLRRWPG
jgi:hypothetical protein